MVQNIHSQAKKEEIEHSEEVQDQSKTKNPAGQTPNSSSLCLMSKYSRSLTPFRFVDYNILLLLRLVLHLATSFPWQVLHDFYNSNILGSPMLYKVKT